MTKEELKILLAELLPAATFEEGSQWPYVIVPSADWLSIAGLLRNHKNLQFDFLYCETCIDWKTKLTMVYFLRSTIFGHELFVKSDLNRDNPEIESVSSIWLTANFNEREVYEMFGVTFLHHPDLRLLILPDGWEGRNPLRKDFEDAVNMIKL